MARVNGIRGIIKGLRDAAKRHEKNFERGITKVGLFIQRESQLIVPVDTANLKNSAFTRKEGSGFDTVIIVGYTAEYAIYVHEDLEAAHAEGKTAKYLERVIRERRPEMREILAGEMQRQ